MLFVVYHKHRGRFSQVQLNKIAKNLKNQEGQPIKIIFDPPPPPHTLLGFETMDVNNYM